jgi:L-threonylcarbamoyladenylate synthase
MRINLEQAASALNKGNVIAVPTETVYGLAASMVHLQAIQQVFDLKGRPAENPLIIHVAEVDQIAEYALDPPIEFEKLAHAFWPGPMTLVIPVKTGQVPAIVRAGLETAGFRIPLHPLARDLLHLTGPLVMPSANLSGRPSSTSAAHVEEDFGLGLPVLDGGACERGVESTILGWSEGSWVIFRLGALTGKDFETVLGYQPPIVAPGRDEKPLCPGQLFRHYSPKAQLILGEPNRMGEAPCILGFAERTYPEGKHVLVLGSLSNPEQVAQNLYETLRQLDREGVQSAWVDMNFPSNDLWRTIAERLGRAGQPSPETS